MSQPKIAETAPACGASPFPLPLSTFETFMCADDRPQYPMTFVFRLTVRGEVEPDAFRGAVDAAVARHALLSAVVRHRAWVESGRMPEMDWAAAEVPLEQGYGGAVDIAAQPGLAIWVRQGVEAAQLYFQFHHAACDGMGAFQFLDDLMAEYHLRHSGLQIPLKRRRLDPNRLTERGTFGSAAPPTKQRLSELLFGLKETLRFFRQKPARLTPPRSYSETGHLPAGHPGFLTQSLEADEVDALREAAAACGAQLNDLLLRDLFLTLRDWQQHRRPAARLQIMMPVSLRDPRERSMPAANVMSYAFLTRQMREIEDAEGLLQTLSRETSAIRKHRLGLYFIGAIAMLDRLGPALPLMLRSGRCFATAVLTNLGDFSRRAATRLPESSGRLQFGNLTLEEIVGIPPLRRGTRAVFSAQTYGGKLTIGIRCDPHLFSLEDAERLLGMYVARLSESQAALAASWT